MISKLYASLFTVLPFGGLAFVLFKYAFKKLSIMINEIKKSSMQISLPIKIIFSLIGGIYGTITSITFFCIFWIPGFKLPQSMNLIILGPLLILIIAMPILIGWTKAIEAGASSVKGASTKLKTSTKAKIQIDKPQGGQWQRKSEDEILQIEKQLKKSSYSPVMPTSVFILLLAVLYVFLPHTSNSVIMMVIISFLSFFLTYLIQIVKGRSLVNKNDYKICNKCFEKDNIGLKACFCGGTYEPQEYFIFKEKSSEV